MGIQVVWDNDEHTVIRYRFDRLWTWEDFFAAKKEANTQIGTVQHKVGVIMDAPPDTTLPSNMLTHGRSALQNKHPNTCILVFVVHNTFVRAMVNTFMKVTKGNSAAMSMAANLDEARTLVAERLSNVQNLPI